MPLSIGRPGSASPPRPETPPSPVRSRPNSAAELHQSVADPSDVRFVAATAAPQQPPADRCSLPGQPIARDLESGSGPIPGSQRPLPSAPAPEPSTETEFPT